MNRIFYELRLIAFVVRGFKGSRRRARVAAIPSTVKAAWEASVLRDLRAAA